MLAVSERKLAFFWKELQSRIFSIADLHLWQAASERSGWLQKTVGYCSYARSDRSIRVTLFSGCSNTRREALKAESLTAKPAADFDIA